MASFSGAITIVSYTATRGTGSGSFVIPAGNYFEGTFTYMTDSGGAISSGSVADLSIAITAGGSNLALASGKIVNNTGSNFVVSDHGAVPLRLGSGTVNITPTGSNVSWAISGFLIK